VPELIADGGGVEVTGRGEAEERVDSRLPVAVVPGGERVHEATAVVKLLGRSSCVSVYDTGIVHTDNPKPARASRPITPTSPPAIFVAVGSGT
jgi:alkanesulfonate monooxygenase SsuD/methylene tetrahydromethanopterin reductase-like flavin-dependent oxidoreductase (luciferase family)